MVEDAQTPPTLQPRGIKTALRVFKRYVRDLQLTDEDLAEGNSIGVVGAADNAFAAGFKHIRGYRGRAFVMGTDPAEKQYHILDPVMINHDARAIGIPSNTFDLVISYQAVPKYFLLQLMNAEAKQAYLAMVKKYNVYSYRIVEEDADMKKVLDSLLAAFSEMVRITKPGGRVKMYPLELGKEKNTLSFDQFVVMKVLDIVKIKYPGLQVNMFRSDDPEMTVHNYATDKTMYGGIELLKPKHTT